jgi:hypothetical protein
MENTYARRRNCKEDVLTNFGVHVAWPLWRSAAVPGRNKAFFCNKCQTQKKSCDFRPSKVSPLGFHTVCKGCEKLKASLLYEKKWRPFKELLTRLKAEMGGCCAECGAPESLEFAHLDPRTKKFTISAGRFYLSEEKVRAEASKCVLLCREHHLKQTKQQRHTNLIPSSPRKGLRPSNGQCSLCTSCKQIKDRNLFHVDRSRDSGCAGWCMECERLYRANYVAGVRAYISSLKVRCTDCPSTTNLEFDHVRGEKKFDIGSFSSRGPALEAELAKCEVVCHECHKLRTKQRQRKKI